jgi:hypothetical protein
LGSLSTLHLVHGVMRAGAILPPQGLAAAIAGGELTLVSENELAALTTRLPAYLPCGTAAADLFSDVERTRATALEHHRVLSEIAGVADIAPVRLGALRTDEGSVRDMLTAEADQLGQALANVSGMVEIAVRILATAAAAAPQAPSAAPATGRDYLRARSAVANATRDHETLATSFARDAAALLTSVASQTRASQAATPVGQPKRWLDLSMLVPRDGIAEIETLLDGLRRRADGLRLAITLAGPWPAYSFVAKEA